MKRYISSFMNCSVAGCDRPQSCRSICQYHYLLARRKGLPLPPRQPRPDMRDRFWSKVNKTGGCWLWTGAVDGRGYGRFNSGGKRGPTLLAHRVAWSICVGRLPDGAYLCHRCDTPPCVRPTHLFIGDAAANAADMVTKGRSAKGSAHSQARLTDADVRRIRALSGTLSQGKIAAEFGVSQGCVTDIVRRKTWSTLK